MKGDVREKGMRRGLSVDGALNEERCVKIGRCRRSQEGKLSFDGEDRNVRVNRLLSYSEAKTRTQQGGKVSLCRFQPVFCGYTVGLLCLSVLLAESGV